MIYSRRFACDLVSSYKLVSPLAEKRHFLAGYKNDACLRGKRLRTSKPLPRRLSSSDYWPSSAPYQSPRTAPPYRGRASARRQISEQSSENEIPTAAAALGSRLWAVIPGNVFASRHQMPPCGSRRKSIRL